MVDMHLSVLIPAYNEEATVEKVIRDHLRALSALEIKLSDWEFICLDDASTDGTSQILTRFSSENPKIKVLRHEQNQGINASFLRLFQEARGTHIYYTASDGQWPAENLERLIRAMTERKLDLVVGVRKNRPQVYGLWRMILSYGFNWLPFVLFGVKTGDANSIKCGRSEIFKMKLVSRSFFGEVERIIRAKEEGYRIGFEPILFLPRTEGKAYGAKWSNIISTARDCFKYFFLRLGGNMRKAD